MTAHDGKDGTKDYFMKGREYYQGLKIDKSGYACFNVEDLEKIEFTMGQIDNGNHSTMKLTIMLDGEIYDKFDEYEVSWRDMLETVTIDVSNATTLYISRDDSCYEQFIALGDITIDDKTPEEISETKNYANADEFVAAAFNAYEFEYSEEIMISGEKKTGFIPNDYNTEGNICFNVENIGTVSFKVAVYDDRNESNTLRVSLDAVEAPNGQVKLTPDMAISETIVVDTSKSSVLCLETDKDYAGYCIVDFEISKDAPTGDNVISPDAVAATPGDANGDNEITVRDCATIAKALAKGEISDLPASADFNGDGEVTVRDAAAIARELSKKK